MSTIAIPRIGEPAPDFKGEAVVGNDFKTIQLSDYKGIPPSLPILKTHEHCPPLEVTFRAS